MGHAPVLRIHSIDLEDGAVVEEEHQLCKAKYASYCKTTVV